jgi:hypothetical protein
LKRGYGSRDRTTSEKKEDIMNPDGQQSAALEEHCKHLNAEIPKSTTSFTVRTRFSTIHNQESDSGVATQFRRNDAATRPIDTSLSSGSSAATIFG